jgi:hypothetical protein
MKVFRPICKICNKNACAINYIKKGVHHYRSHCDSCGKGQKKIKPVTLWQQAGYKKDTTCFLCGFQSLYPTQMTVYHIDGKLTNVDFINLRTICLNCVEVVKHKNVKWKRGDLTVDY